MQVTEGRAGDVSRVVQISEDREVDGKGFQLKEKKGQKSTVRCDNDELEGRCG